MAIFTPFSIPILSTKVDYDFSELRKDTRFVYNKGQAGGSFTEDNFRILEHYPALKDYLLDKSIEYIKSIGLTQNYTVTTSWLTKTCKGESIMVHRHLNCQFSGVLYYGEDYTNANPLIMINPTAELDNFEQPVSQGNAFFSNFESYPTTGMLILFPAYLKHYVDKHQEDVTRHSLAFNLHPTGVIGSGDSKVDTKWLL